MGEVGRATGKRLRLNLAPMGTSPGMTIFLTARLLERLPRLVLSQIYSPCPTIPPPPGAAGHAITRTGELMPCPASMNIARDGVSHPLGSQPRS